MIREHVAAVKALLESQGLTVYEGGADSTATVPYAVLWSDSGTRSRETLCASSDRVDMLLSVTSVGTQPEQAAWVAERVFTALLDTRPAITGRVCSPIAHEISDPVRRDNDVIAPGGGLLYSQVDVFRLVTRPG